MLTKEASTKPATLSSLLRRMVAHAHDLRAELSHEPDPDTLAQSIVCAAPILAAAPCEFAAARDWLYRQLASWERNALDQAQVLSTQYSVHPPPTPLLSPLRNPQSAFRIPPPAHLYDQFLNHHSKISCKRHGVFFTPRPIADYIITQIDRLLHEDFNLPDGLAQSKIQNLKSKICLLDPACGTGVFLLTLIDHLHRRVSPERWNTFVPDLLSRLIGIEILPAAALLAKLNIALQLAHTGYDFSTPAKINILTGDALSPETQSKIQSLKPKILPIIVGNPPFSSLSTNTNPWIARLVRGDDEVRGYIRANGQQLNERKTWLHDDYVKFIRLAQWHVEQAGCGIVGFVTNHGYLDNATFRLMRHELLRVFPQIQIVDLHGNRRARGIGVPPVLRIGSVRDDRDENVFHLDQGVAIGLFCRPPATQARSASEGPNPQATSRLEHLNLWGSRTSKLASLSDNSPVPCPPGTLWVPVSFTPTAPDYRFVPSPPPTRYPEYSSAWSLADAMPVHTTAPVTARDHFVVAFTAEELKARIEDFRNLSIPDDEIRRRYFTRTRSARYQSGDTRGWKLAEARRIVAADFHWQEKIIRCLYRPFDWRYIFWHPAMIDWPRTEVTRHLARRTTGQGDTQTRGQGEWSSPCLPLSLSPPLCLIARRQQLPTQPCTFFWIADCLALDGVIRSDNRGSESLFPLYLNGDHPGKPANFAPAFVAQFSQATDLAWQPFARGDLQKSFGPEDLLAYIYALFHSPTYRERYADSLRSDFPRILPPRDACQFSRMSRLGNELIDLHLLRRQLSLSPPLPVSPSISGFRAGGYVALHKWLQPKHRSPTDPHYPRISAAIARTLEITPAIDAAFTDSCLLSPASTLDFGL